MPRTTTATRLSGGLVLAAALAGFGVTAAQAAPTTGITATAAVATTTSTAATGADDATTATTSTAAAHGHRTLAAGPAAGTSSAPAFARGTGVTPTHLGIAAGGGMLVGLTALATRGVRRARGTAQATGRGGV